MFRPHLSPCGPLLGLTLLLAGCQTMYRDVYSPKRNYYKPPREKSTEVVLPPEPPDTIGNTSGVGTTPPSTPPGPTTPPPSTTPAIPGLEDVPAPPPPATPPGT